VELFGTVRGQVVSVLLGFERSESVKHYDFFRRYPLHIACATPNPFSGELAQLLCKHFPEATKLEDGVARIPIEYAVDNPSPTAGDVVAAVLKENPEGVVRDARHDDGITGGLAGAQATVIHKCASAAFINRDPGARNILQHLVDHNRDAAGVPDRYGRTPLHLAVENLTPAGLAAVRLLTNACPNTVNVQDCHGNTPLHDAAALCNVACIKHLVRGGRKEKPGREKRYAPNDFPHLCLALISPPIPCKFVIFFITFVRVFVYARMKTYGRGRCR
jgi:hypothetical protein